MGLRIKGKEGEARGTRGGGAESKMPVAQRAPALPGSWDRSRSSSSWRAARGEIIPRTYSRAPAAPPAPGGSGRRAREGRGPLEAGQVPALGRLRSSQVCGPAKAAAAPGFPPKAHTKEILLGFAIPELVSGSEQDRTNLNDQAPALFSLLLATRAGKPSVLHQAPAHQASACCGLSG